MTSGPPILAPPTGVPGLGPAVGMAERALTRLLAGILAETGTPTLTWYAFQRLAVFGIRTLTAVTALARALTGPAR